jgi:hypothetical protein
MTAPDGNDRREDSDNGRRAVRAAWQSSRCVGTSEIVAVKSFGIADNVAFTSMLPIGSLAS